MKIVCHYLERTENFAYICTEFREIGFHTDNY